MMLASLIFDFDPSQYVLLWMMQSHLGETFLVFFCKGNNASELEFNHTTADIKE